MHLTEKLKISKNSYEKIKEEYERHEKDKLLLEVILIF